MRWLVGVALFAACGSSGSAERAGTNPDPPLNLHVIVENLPGGLHAEDFVLVDQATDPPVRYPASGVELATADDPAQIMVVIQGDEPWMGNETYTPRADTEYTEGAFRATYLAMDVLGATLPAKAQVTIYTYFYDYQQLAGPMDAKLVTGAVLGAQENYNGLYGGTLLYALQQAETILRETASPRRDQALIVIGDGMAQEMNAQAYIEPIADRLRKEHVSVYTVQFTPLPGSAEIGVGNMAVLGFSGAHVASSQASMVESAQAIATAIAEHTGGYRVTFGVYDPPDDFSTFGVEVRGELVNDFTFPGFDE